NLFAHKYGLKVRFARSIQGRSQAFCEQRPGFGGTVPSATGAGDKRLDGDQRLVALARIQSQPLAGEAKLEHSVGSAHSPETPLASAHAMTLAGLAVTPVSLIARASLKGRDSTISSNPGRGVLCRRSE